MMNAGRLAQRQRALPVLELFVAAVADGVARDAEECELLVERREADMLRQVDASRPVVAEHVAEQLRIAVEEILVGVGVVEELFLDGAEQRVRVLLDGLLPRLKAPAAHVEAKSSVSEAAWSTVVYRWRHRTACYRDPADRRRARQRQPTGNRRHYPRLGALVLQTARTLYTTNRQST